MSNKFLLGLLISVVTLAACIDSGTAGTASAGGAGAPIRPPVDLPPVTSIPGPDCDQENAVKTSNVDALPGGLWGGSLINCVTMKRSDYAFAMVTEDGRFRVFGPDRLLLSGQLGTDGDTFNGRGREFESTGLSNQSSANMTAAGTIDERTSLVGRWNSEGGFNGVFALRYDRGYELLPSSFDELPGTRATWELHSNAEGIWTMEADGKFNGQDDQGCSQSGEFRLIDSRFNLYEIEYLVVGCAAGGSYNGLASVGRDGLTGDRLLDISADDGDERAARILIYF